MSNEQDPLLAEAHDRGWSPRVHVTEDEEGADMYEVDLPDAISLEHLSGTELAKLGKQLADAEPDAEGMYTLRVTSGRYRWSPQHLQLILRHSAQP